MLIGLLWWPAVVIGAIAMVVGWRRGRTTIAVFADLVEAATDLHLRDLATNLGVPTDDDAGRKITERIRKDT